MRRPVRNAIRVAVVVTAVLAAAIPVTQAAFAANGASATFTKTGDWGSGYEGKYTIVNGSTGRTHLAGRVRSTRRRDDLVVLGRAA